MYWTFEKYITNQSRFQGHSFQLRTASKPIVTCSRICHRPHCISCRPPIINQAQCYENVALMVVECFTRVYFHWMIRRFSGRESINTFIKPGFVWIQDFVLNGYWSSTQHSSTRSTGSGTKEESDARSLVTWSFRILVISFRDQFMGPHVQGWRTLTKCCNSPEASWHACRRLAEISTSSNWK